ncbi:hypothetical protein LY90DRAFT_512112 [Neocallimastix californiae]|uniref:ABC transporter domain-containing protein n=1 Tax=Neocallimastix californiae TaxID=1754190 RepID=A0A1Y2BEP1_9FUNG|nr:hypothetical protein LY90DRAFT_512112 [Neocallimastix californiae]|eukprot:ORY33166.1 hypothetical protein LY90DRAFT_512112 [Neocallimastix californiae]
MKINVLNNEQELYSQYHAKINFFQYGIKFISPTEYTLYFGYSNELKDILKYNTEMSYILDYDYYDPIQTASIIQMCIDKAIIKTVSNKFNDVSIKVETKPMDQQKFSLEYSVNSMKSYIPFLMIIYFIPCICNLLNYLVIEKETKIKNSLIIIGLRKSNIWISWALVYGIVIIVSSILGSHFIYKFDIFLFIKQRIIISIYLDNVLPQGSNLHRPWHFPITDLFRCCIIKKFNSRNRNINSFALLKEQNPYIEDDSAITKNASVRIENIQKTFKGKSDDFVLNEISFNAYKNEIFAILGHNSAGKSTLLNIMTGVLSALRGNIFYNNKGLFGNETSICKDFGYCPQFDTFSKLLTVEEQVKLFNGIKRSKELSQNDIDTILQEIGLYEKKISFPHELSGGQRRKLCIALAFLGFGVHSSSKDNVIVNENPEFASSFILYFNNTYSFSLPIAINYLSNAILSEANVTPKISVTYQPFTTTQYENWYIDDEKLINNYKEYNKSSLEPLNMIIISITLSLTLSLYGSLVVKEREFGMTHQLLLKGTKHITYWIGILIGDFICTLIPVVLIFFGGLINNIDLFSFKYLPYTFGITILWIVGCLIFQYLSSSLFKNYEQASRLNVLLNPMISIGIGILIYTIFMSNNVEYVTNVGSTEELKPMNDNYKLYAVLLFYWPSFISVFYTELSTFIFKRRYSINNEELRQYIASKRVQDILNNSNRSYLEKSDLITIKFFNLKVPSFSDVLLLENKKFTKYILIMLIAIFLYTFILFLMEKGKIKKFKKHHKISSNNKDETLKWLNDEPEDVQREYRSISYSINTNQILKKKKQN